jgi:hypothetical protein
MKESWKVAADGNFNTPIDWSLGFVPSFTDVAAITLFGSYTVTANTNQTVLAVSTSGLATLAITGSSKFVATAGTGPGANHGSISIADGSTFQIGGVLNNSGGTVFLNAAGHATTLAIASNTLLKGGGTLVLDADTHNAITIGVTQDNVVLTNVDNIIEGAGTIGPGAGLMDSGLINEKLGVIDAELNAQHLMIACNVDNTGLVEGTGAAGLRINSAHIFNGPGGVIKADNGSRVDLAMAQVLGGTLETFGSGVIEAVDDSQLADVSNTGNFVVTDGVKVALDGIINNTGTVAVDGNTAATALTFGPTFTEHVATLQGGGKITLTDSANNSVDANGVGGSAALNNVNNTIAGAGTIKNLDLNNEKLGVVNATGAVNPLIIDNAIVNAGLLEATGAAGLQLTDVVTNSPTGTIEAGDGSLVDLFDTVNGGTLKTLGTGIIFSQDARLDGSRAAVPTSTMLTNAGTLRVKDTYSVTLAGTINNTGEIDLESTGNATSLIVQPTLAASALLSSSKVTLEGHGQVVLSDFSANTIFGEGLTVDAPVTLLNLNNTISGSGLIGAGSLALNNGLSGLIVATGIVPLIIDTGATAIVNAGTLQANAGSVLCVGSNLSNTGHLNANGGTIVVAGKVTGTILGSGAAVISAAGQVEFGDASSSSTKFAAGSTGRLILDDSVQYTGTVSGFGANHTQAIDLADIIEATATLSFSNGILTVNDHGGHIAHIKFAGSFTTGSFTKADDGGGGLLLTDPAIDHAPHTIDDGGTLEIDGGATGKVTFAGPSGTLLLDSSWSFRGEVAGFGGQDRIDLADVAFGDQTTLGYARSSAAAGTLTVSDGIHAARIALLGNYVASSFAAANDGHGGTLLSATPFSAAPPAAALEQATVHLLAPSGSH